MNIFDRILSLFRRPAQRPTPTPAPPPPTPQPTVPPGVIKELLDAHNAERKKVNLPPLALDVRLCEAAGDYARVMARANVLSHDLNGSVFYSRISRAGYLWLDCSENIAEGQRTVSGVMASWMSSRGHRGAILGRFDDVGFGVAAAEDGTVYWCSDFGLRR